MYWRRLQRNAKTLLKSIFFYSNTVTLFAVACGKFPHFRIFEKSNYTRIRKLILRNNFMHRSHALYIAQVLEHCGKLRESLDTKGGGRKIPLPKVNFPKGSSRQEHCQNFSTPWILYLYTSTLSSRLDRALSGFMDCVYVRVSRAGRGTGRTHFHGHPWINTTVWLTELSSSSKARALD